MNKAKNTMPSAQLDMMPLISITEMTTKLKKSRVTIYRWVKSHQFIQPVYRNKRTIGWCSIKFEQWLLGQK